MGLLQLLNAGSSLARVKDVGRYHLTKQQALPTFGAKKPEANAPEAAPVAVVREEAATANGRWWKKANPFAPVQAQPANGAARQTELSLDKVKVVRSDLNEADVIVLPKAPPGTTIPAKRYVRPNRQPDELGKKAWSLLGSRLFGAGQH